MLSIIDWRITYLCNNFCDYCYGSKKLPIMSREQEDVVVQKILDSDSRIVNITGGEPMLDSDRTRAIIKKLHDGGKKVYLSTNAFNGIENLDFILDNVSLLGLPLDGYDFKTQSVCGRSPKSFDEVFAMLRAIENSGRYANVKIGTVITRLNYDVKTLFEIYKLISKFSCVKIWRLYEFIPVNRGETHGELVISDSERSEVEKTVSQLMEKSERIKIEFVTRINRGSTYFIIQPDGSVMVPVEQGEKSVEEVIGDLANEDFNTILSRWHKTYTFNEEYISTRISDALGVRK